MGTPPALYVVHSQMLLFVLRIASFSVCVDRRRDADSSQHIMPDADGDYERAAIC